MKFYNKLNWVASILVGIGMLAIASCGGDDKPAPKAGINFATQETNIYESDGEIGISVTMDKPVSEDVIIKFSFGGDAKQKTAANPDGDFWSDQGGSVTIPAGSTNADIEIEFVEDGIFEIYQDFRNYDSLIITLTSVSGPGVIGEASTHVVYALEDDLWVLLDPTEEEDPVFDEIDLDLFVWVDDPEDEPDEGFFVLTRSVGGVGVLEDIILLPFKFDFDLATSVVYYEGTSDDVKFTLSYLNFGILLDDPDNFITSFDGVYDTDNLNNYGDKEADNPEIAYVQSFQRVDNAYTGYTSLDIPATGSRVSPLLVPSKKVFDRSRVRSSLKQIDLATNGRLKKLLERNQL